MWRNKIIFAIIICGTIGFIFFLQPPDYTVAGHDVETEIRFGANNDPVYLGGCQTHHPPIPPKVIYKTVKKNFVTLPCALEVLPPYGAIEFQKRLSFY
jgi:hypothetical protein